MPSPLLIDTDVLIDYLRDHPAAVSFIESLSGPLFVSVITVAELYAGVREGNERTILSEFVNSFAVLPITKEIAVAGGLYRRDYGSSHGVGINDALIAATAMHNKSELITLNRKHFPMLSSVTVPYEKG